MDKIKKILDSTDSIAVGILAGILLSLLAGLTVVAQLIAVCGVAYYIYLGYNGASK